MGGNLGFSQRRLNRRKHTLNVSHHIIIPEPKHLISALLQIGGALLIRDDSSSLIVLPTVDLNNDPSRMARKIGEVRTNRGLAAEVSARKRRLPQTRP